MPTQSMYVYSHAHIHNETRTACRERPYHEKNTCIIQFAWCLLFRNSFYFILKISWDSEWPFCRRKIKVFFKIMQLYAKNIKFEFFLARTMRKMDFGIFL